MTTTTNNGSNSNGKVRRSLADQIDRLDAVIDALADGLNESVMVVVEKAVTVAVKEAVAQALSNPELRGAMGPRASSAYTARLTQPDASIVPPRKPSIWQRLGGAVQAGWNWLTGMAGQAGTALCQAAGSCADKVASAASSAWNWTVAMLSGAWIVLALLGTLACRFRVPLLIALGIGLVIGVGCYLAGPVVASTISGFAGFVGSLIAGFVRNVWRSALDMNPEEC